MSACPSEQEQSLTCDESVDHDLIVHDEILESIAKRQMLPSEILLVVRDGRNYLSRRRSRGHVGTNLGLRR